ncbi:MAG: YchF family ATPase [Kiritimatiellae bacterium]|nr:YchF family ATPase [Kiritimatiellia bacterium]
MKVPDARLDALRDLFRPRKFTPAEITFADIMLPGAEGAAFRESVPTLAQADAFVLVVQAFGETDGDGRPLDPAAQMETVLLEMTIADFEQLGRRLERIRTDRRHGAKVSAAELALLERCHQHLATDQPLRSLALRPDEEKLIRTYQFLSRKPLFVVANVDERSLRGTDAQTLEAAARARGLDLVKFCAPIEADIALMEPETQREFLREYELDEPARVRLIRTAYHALNLISFFTVGEDEVRAWTVARGTTAQVAAGKIHSDMERGFIRAEVVPAETLLAAGSLARCREAGTLRIEGKDYVVQDGDVIHVRFSV